MNKFLELDEQIREIAAMIASLKDSLNDIDEQLSMTDNPVTCDDEATLSEQFEHDADYYAQEVIINSAGLYSSDELKKYPVIYVDRRNGVIN